MNSIRALQALKTTKTIKIDINELCNILITDILGTTLQISVTTLQTTKTVRIRTLLTDPNQII